MVQVCSVQQAILYCHLDISPLPASCSAQLHSNSCDKSTVVCQSIHTLRTFATFQASEFNHVSNISILEIKKNEKWGVQN